MLLKQIELNKYTIKLEDWKKLFYKLIYSLAIIELETFKIYIKTHLKPNFICTSKSPTDTFIQFNKKLDSYFKLCVNYQGLKNLTIKN